MEKIRELEREINTIFRNAYIDSLFIKLEEGEMTREEVVNKIRGISQ